MKNIVKPLNQEIVTKKVYETLEKDILKKKHLYFNSDGTLNKENQHLKFFFNIMLSKNQNKEILSVFIKELVNDWCQKNGYSAQTWIEDNHRTNYTYDKMLQLVSELKFVYFKSKEIIFNKRPILISGVIRIDQKAIADFEQAKIKETVLGNTNPIKKIKVL